MFKRNTPDKYEASTGCVRETPQMKNKIKKGKKRRKGNEHGMCKRNSPHKKKSQHRRCKRNSPYKNEDSMGCVRETPHRKVKPKWDV